MSQSQTADDEAEFVHITEKQVEVSHDDEAEEYKIVAGNPLTGEIDFETTTSWLKIDGVGFSLPSAQISEHGIKIGITESGNIVLDV